MCGASVGSGTPAKKLRHRIQMCSLILEARSSRGPPAGPRMLSHYNGLGHGAQVEVGSGLGKLLLHEKVGGVECQ